MRQKKIFKGAVVDFLPNLVKNINVKIQKVYLTSRDIPITVIPLKIKYKEKNCKCLHRQMAHYMQEQKNSDDGQEIMQVRKQKNDTFKELEFGEGERE